MLELIAIIYALIVWLIFIKFKLLPWNIKSQVACVAVGLAGIALLVFTINITTPQSNDIRVMNYVVEIIPRVNGRIIEVPIEGNKLIRKGDVLVRIDPTPFEMKVRELTAKLVDAEGTAATLRSEAAVAKGATGQVLAQLHLAQTRLKEARDLARHGAGPEYDVQSFSAQVAQLESSLASARAAEAKIQTQLDAKVGADRASVAAVREQLAQAKWELEQTVIHAPSDGYVVNLQVRPGSYAVSFPLRQLMSFVELEQRVIGFYDQNQLIKVKEGDRAEIVLRSRPGKVLHGHVESIIWANASGQLQASGVIPTMAAEGTRAPPLKYAVRFKMEDSRELKMAMGSFGEAAIFTDSMKMFSVVRMVIMRIKTKINYLVFKLE